MVARLTPDQKVACSNHVRVTSFCTSNLSGIVFWGFERHYVLQFLPIGSSNLGPCSDASAPLDSNRYTSFVCRKKKDIIIRLVFEIAKAHRNGVLGGMEHRICLILV